MEINNIAVIILTWKNYGDTRDCINSILKSTVIPDEVLIIDNSSNDGSLEKLIIEFKEYPFIRFIANTDNLGFAKGVNKGIKHYLNNQGIKQLVLLNQDTLVDSCFIEECRQTLRENPRIGIVGPRIYYFNKHRKIWHGPLSFNHLKCGMINAEKNKTEDHLVEENRETEFLTGCAMFINKGIFIKTGLFDEDYFFYFEDSDFCLKVRKAGFKLWFNSKAKIWHKITDIAKDRTNPHVMYNIAKGYILFLRKNFPFYYIVYGLILHFILYTPFRFWQILTGSRSYRSILAWFIGTLDGLKLRLEKSKYPSINSKKGAF